MVLLKSSTHALQKTTRKEILNCFQPADRSIRLLVAIIVFCMGMNCKGVRPSKNVERYIQETVRAGRRDMDMDEVIFSSDDGDEEDALRQWIEIDNDA